MRDDLDRALDALCIAQTSYNEGNISRESVEDCKDHVV